MEFKQNKHPSRKTIKSLSFGQEGFKPYLQYKKLNPKALTYSNMIWN